MGLQLEELTGSPAVFRQRKGSESRIDDSRVIALVSHFDMTMYKGRRRNQRCEYEAHEEGVSEVSLKLMMIVWTFPRCDFINSGVSCDQYH